MRALKDVAGLILLATWLVALACATFTHPVSLTGWYSRRRRTRAKGAKSR